MASIIWGGPPASPEEDGDRFIEIWNVVFHAFNRSAPMALMVPLPKASVDTGMGLERNWRRFCKAYIAPTKIDLGLQNFPQGRCEISGTDDLVLSPLRVIADHIPFHVLCGMIVGRCYSLLNEGPCYGSLRRIVRRAGSSNGTKIGDKKGVFFHKLVDALDP